MFAAARFAASLETRKRGRFELVPVCGGVQDANLLLQLCRGPIAQHHVTGVKPWLFPLTNAMA